VPCDHHVFVSRYLLSQYKNLIGKLIRKYEIIPPCIQANKFEPITPKYKDRVVGKIATPNNPAKYPYLLLNAAKAAKAKLMMPGANKYFGEGDDIIDVQPNWWSVGRYLSQMSVFLYVNDPSMGPETWCRCVTEALAAGLPVIGENRGGVAEQVIDGVNGYLVDPWDKGRIKHLVNKLLNKPNRLKTMGQAARKIKDIADVSVLRRKLAPVLLKLALGGV
jgi:glycosyltransferase involved in cell wall biosynthesis